MPRKVPNGVCPEEKESEIAFRREKTTGKGHDPVAPTITDVTLREYGQNISPPFLPIFTPGIRVEIALKLIAAGFADLEVISCVHPGVAPAMDSKTIETIAKGIGRQDNVHIITLVPNGTGYENFLALGLGPEGFNHTMGIFSLQWRPTTGPIWGVPLRGRFRNTGEL